ncbi:hypothetical protein EAI_02266, partial [Harpegnathos saltator]
NYFINKLRLAISHNISHSTLQDLLQLLKSEANICVPQDPRPLLHTPRHIFSKPVGSGTYSHIEVQSAVEKLINLLEEQSQKLNLLVNIDGLPFSKSSNTQISHIML